MTFENPDFAFRLIVVLALLVVLQAVFFTIFWLLLNKLLRKVDKKLTLPLQKAGEAAEEAQSLAGKLAPLVQKVTNFESEVTSVLNLTRKFASQGDQALVQGLTSARSQAERASNRIDSVLGKFTEQTFKVHRTILHPAIELSAIIRGARTVLSRLFSRDKTAPPLQDKEIFI